MTGSRWILVASVIAVVACEREPAPIDREPAEVLWSDDTLTQREIEAGRQDDSWREVVRIDRPALARMTLDTIAIPESWRDIGDPPSGAPLPEIHLPLFGEAEGPSVLYVQVLLDRARFSPGILDGKWGKNTEKAVYWFQTTEELPTTGVVDSITIQRLTIAAGSPRAYVREIELTEADVSPRLVQIPEDVYQQKDLPCMCHETLIDDLAERFHTTPGILAELNPEIDLDGLRPGDRLRIPNVGVGRSRIVEPVVDRIVVSGLGFYVHALDADGRILYHFPTTLGSRYNPSPEGDYEIVSVTPNPWFHYQPRLLTGADPTKPNTLIPPGPNNPVGDVWIKLSKPHFGIHGTSEPSTIGYATSSGCVRLTNWDVRFLSTRITAGTPVGFSHTREFEAPDPGDETPPATG